MSIAVPRHPRDITPEWLTSVFQAASSESSPPVTGVAAEVIGTDHGFTGTVARLNLEYESDSDASYPCSVVVKMPHTPRETDSTYQTSQSTSPKARRSLLDRGIREIAFYDDLVPRSQLAVPQRHFSVTDPETLASILALEDLADASPGDVLLGCSPADASNVLRAIADLHAAWWDRPSHSVPDWLHVPAPNPLTRQQRYAAALPEFVRRYSAHITSSFRDLYSRLERAIPTLLVQANDTLQTVIHADLHLDNVMFTPFDPAVPVRILDWQTVRTGPASHDIVMLMISALSPLYQRNETDALLREYHTALLERGVANYSLDRLRHDYRMALLRHVVSVVIWLGTADMSALAGRERSVVEAAIGDGRLIAAAESQQLITAIPTG